MATIYRPCYCTREEVRRALELKMAAYDNVRIDRAILAAAEAVEGLTQRRFYTEISTRKFDWPNFQYTYPWKLYLDQNELATNDTTLITVQTGSLLAVPVTIAGTDYILHPVNDGPPYTRLELRRDRSAAFGSNPTPQLDIAITGPFGYWMKTYSGGVLDGQVAVIDTSLKVHDSSLFDVGDVLGCGTEKMIVQDSAFVDTAVIFSGLSEAKANDRVVSVADSSLFHVGEVLQADSEWLLIENILAANRLVVRRGWDGSLLEAHTGGTLYARRQFTVLRAALGTTAAIYADNTALTVAEVPALVKELAIAEAVVWLTQEHGAYGGASAQSAGAGREPVAGPGLPDIRDRVCNSRFTRKIRMRVVLCRATLL